MTSGDNIDFEQILRLRNSWYVYAVVYCCSYPALAF